MIAGVWYHAQATTFGEFSETPGYHETQTRLEDFSGRIAGLANRNTSDRENRFIEFRPSISDFWFNSVAFLLLVELVRNCRTTTIRFFHTIRQISSRNANTKD